MARKRIIYQSEALFTDVNGTGASSTGDGIVQLHRVQDIGHSVDLGRTDINEFGQLSYIAREVTEPPTVGLDFTYYAVGGWNESGIGLTVRDSRGITNERQALSGFMASSAGSNDNGQNYYVLTVPEGEDATAGMNGSGTPFTAAQSAKNAVIGFGNGNLSSYSFEASVGDIPTASVSIEASNINYEPDSHEFQNPAINTTDGSKQPGVVTLPSANSGVLGVAALRAGDITLDFQASNALDGGGVSLDTTTGILVQNFSIELPLSRTPIQRMGSFLPFARPLDLPASTTLSVNAIIAEAYQSGNLADLLCAAGQGDKRDITINMYEKCSRSNLNMQFVMKGAYLDSQNMSSSIGDNKTVDLVFSSQLGGANDTENGVFISGADAGKQDLR